MRSLSDQCQCHAPIKIGVGVRNMVGIGVKFGVGHGVGVRAVVRTVVGVKVGVRVGVGIRFRAGARVRVVG